MHQLYSPWCRVVAEVKSSFLDQVPRIQPLLGWVIRFHSKDAPEVGNQTEAKQRKPQDPFYKITHVQGILLFLLCESEPQMAFITCLCTV